jgi:hypothetical protein
LKDFKPEKWPNIEKSTNVHRKMHRFLHKKNGISRDSKSRFYIFPTEIGDDLWRALSATWGDYAAESGFLTDEFTTEAR